MEKFPEADHSVADLLDTGTGDSYLGPGASLQPAIRTTKGHFRTLGTVLSRLADQAGVESVGVYTLRIRGRGVA